jgi:aminopeptidase YwaD
MGDAQSVILPERLLGHLSEVVRERDPKQASGGHSYVRAYLRKELARYGRTTVHEFEHEGLRHQNIILDLPGAHSKRVILLGAHYDAVPGSPGADDNGTALAVLLEVARAFHADPARSTIRLVAFDLEERDRAGSRAYARDMLDRSEQLELMIALEMLGYRDAAPGSQHYPVGLGYFYPDRGDYIGLIGNLRTARTMRRLAGTMRDFVPCEFMAVPFRATRERCELLGY